MMLIKIRFGVLMKWTLTMFRHGVRAAKVTLKTAKCCAKLTIEQKVIGKMLKNMIWNYVDIKLPIDLASSVIGADSDLF